MIAAFIVDSWVAMSWCFHDEATPQTAALLSRMATEAAAVPSLWFLEVTNVLVLAERKKRITPAKAAQFITLLESFEWQVHEQAHSRAFGHIALLCRTHALTAYDALYLDLAVSQNLPLATLDEPLRKAAAKLGVKLLGK